MKVLEPVQCFPEQSCVGSSAVMPQTCVHKYQEGWKLLKSEKNFIPWFYFFVDCKQVWNYFILFYTPWYIILKLNTSLDFVDLVSYLYIWQDYVWMNFLCLFFCKNSVALLSVYMSLIVLVLQRSHFYPNLLTATLGSPCLTYKVDHRYRQRQVKPDNGKILWLYWTLFIVF